MIPFKTRYFRLTLGLALASAVVVGLANPAFAAQPTTASGTFTLVDLASRVLTLQRTADGNSFYAVSHETPAYSGGLTGTATDTYTLIVHDDGTIEGYGTEVCTSCTIGGLTGGYTAVFTFQGTFADAVGHVAFQSGTGSLLGLHGGGGTFEGSTFGTYSYNFLFAP